MPLLVARQDIRGIKADTYKLNRRNDCAQTFHNKSTQETQSETLVKEKKETGALKDKEERKRLINDRRMNEGDKWRKNDITQLFMFLCVIQFDHQSIVCSVFISC